MMEHSPSAWRHDLFSQNIIKVANHDLWYRAIIFYLEEDWLLSKTFDWGLLTKDVSLITDWRQFSLNKYDVRNLKSDPYMKYISSYKGHVSVVQDSDKTLVAIKQKKLLTLNPCLINRKIVDYLQSNFMWEQDTSGFELELELGNFLSDLPSYTWLPVARKEYYITHIGLVTTTKFLNLNTTNKLNLFMKFWLQHYVWKTYLTLPYILRQLLRRLMK